MKKRPAAVAAASQSSFLTRPPSGSEETRVLMPRAFHLGKLETGWEKTPMMNAGGIKGMAPPFLRPNVILTKWRDGSKGEGVKNWRKGRGEELAPPEAAGGGGG